METCQVVLRESCNCSVALTRRRRFLFEATATGESGIPPLVRSVPLVAVCGLLVALSALPARAACLCGDTVTISHGGSSTSVVVSCPGTDLPCAGPVLGFAGPACRFDIDIGTSTIRIDFTQLQDLGPATVTFSDLDCAIDCPDGSTVPGSLSNVVVTTNHPTFIPPESHTADSVSVTLGAAGTPTQWNPGEFIELMLDFQGPCPCAPEIVVTDTEFDPSDWTHSILYSQPVATLFPTQQILTGGCANNLAYQQGRHMTNGPFATIYDGHVFVGGGSYNPATQGAISTLDVSYCYKDLVGSGTQNGLLIEQGARIFIYFVDSSGPHPQWTTLSQTGIVDVWSPSWVELTGGVITNFTAPDFSTSGAPMQFGYYTFNWSQAQGFLIDHTWGVDDFRVTIMCDCTLAGECDDFALPTEPTFVSPQLAVIINGNVGSCNGGVPRPFDSGNDADCFFGNSFEGLSNACCPAELTIRMMADNTIPGTDSLSLGVAPNFAWGLSLNALDGMPALCTHTTGTSNGMWSMGEDMTCVLDLCNLPPDADGTTIVMSGMRSSGWLDVFIQDDTSVDCITLCNNTCPCIQPPLDLAHWWPLDEPAGPIANDVISGINGTHLNGPVPVPAGWVAGALSTGAPLGGHVNVPDSPSTLEIDLVAHPLGFTVDLWYKCDVCSDPSKQSIIRKMDNQGVGYLLEVGPGPGGYCWGVGQAVPPVFDGL